MSKISAVIVAHNEEKKIADCLKSLSFVDEIVVVLDKCTDGTKEIVQKFTDKIIEGSWRIEGARRNVALSAASHDWILEVDCDERFSTELAAEILEIAKISKPCAAKGSIDNFVGKRLVKFGWLRTVAPLEREYFTFRGLKKYHEDREIHPTYDLKAEVKILKNSLTHLMDDDVADTIARFNRYTTWRANDMVANGKIKGGFFKNIVDFKLRFLKAFVVKKGYKEGALGFLIAILAGLYPLVSYLKALERKKI
jgi:glycosyltransferase involved in cell wall biosynthesis